MDVRKLYAKAAVLGMVKSGSHEDEFHQLVYGITGKDSVKALTEQEMMKVEKELSKRLKLMPSQDTKHKQESPGKMTHRQKAYAWRMIYSLDALSPSKADVNERMAGAVRKILGITSAPSDPLLWVSFDDGIKLIEQLKRYVKTAQRKKALQDESG